MERIEFRATLPPIMSAVRIGGDGLRLQLDVPQSDLAAALPIVGWQGTVLRVAIEPLQNNEVQSSAIRQGPEREPRWQTPEE